MKNALSKHENHLLQLKSANTGRAPRRQGCFKCGHLGHLAKNCSTMMHDSSNHRLEYPCETMGEALHTSVPSKVLTIPSKGPGNCFVQGYLANIPVSFFSGHRGSRNGCQE